MPKATELNIQLHWHQSAENDPQFAQDNLLELVKFLARRAAERDFKNHLKHTKERKDSYD